MRLRSVTQSRRFALFAGVSVAALAVASPDAMAADLPAKAPAYAPPVAQNSWTWWVEGGAFSTSDPAAGPFPLSLSPPVGIQPNIGGEGAIGFDSLLAAWPGYHISGQFRYGYAQRSGKTFPANIAVPSPPGVVFTTRTTSVFAKGAGSADIKEHHWLVDIMIGRDFHLGSGDAQVKAGIRVADIYAKITGNGSVSGGDAPGGGGSPITGVFTFASRSKFLGVGPRFAVDGEIPLGGKAPQRTLWSIDYGAGVAVLIGSRSLDSSSTLNLVLNPGAGPAFATVSTALSSSSTGVVPNVDGQLGVSYHFNSNSKITVSYRFDGYFGALRTLNSSGAIINEDVFYYGPMMRATFSF